MTLPIKPPFYPMEAQTRDEIPAGSQWQYEPKWDGFRCLAFRDGDNVELLLDGEIVIPIDGKLSFDDLLMRIHPAASRIKKLASETPATKDLALVKRWFKIVGGGLDGVIAKRSDLACRSGGRTGMVKVKHLRTADCVIGGFRYASKGKMIGSLLLGLYDKQGLLHHVGFSSSFKEAEKKDLTALVEKLIEPPGFTGQAPGGPSRWSTERSAEWHPLAQKLVAEVQYDHFTGGRFRHGTKFLRWRPDKAPKQCTLDQVRPERKSPLKLLEENE